MTIGSLNLQPKLSPEIWSYVVAMVNQVAHMIALLNNRNPSCTIAVVKWNTRCLRVGEVLGGHRPMLQFLPSSEMACPGHSHLARHPLQGFLSPPIEAPIESFGASSTHLLQSCLAPLTFPEDCLSQGEAADELRMLSKWRSLPERHISSLFIGKLHDGLAASLSKRQILSMQRWGGGHSSSHKFLGRVVSPFIQHQHNFEWQLNKWS